MLYPTANRRLLIARRRGFTLAESVVTTFLNVLLGMLMAATVAAIVHPSTKIERRAHLALEANLAAEALAYDASDYFLEADGCLGTLEDRQAMRQSDWKSDPKPWEFVSENNTLVLRRSFNTPGSSIPTCVDYFQQGTRLIRRVSGGPPSSTVVASHVTGFNPSPCDAEGEVSPTGTCARIELTLTYDTDDPGVERKGNCSATFVLIAVPPP